jgi:hypothetical protein
MSTSLLQLVDNLQQAGKIRNLQQVCGVSGCVDSSILCSNFAVKILQLGARVCHFRASIFQPSNFHRS